MLDTLPDPDLAKQLIVKCTLVPQRLGNAEEFAHLVQCIVENPYMNAAVIRMDAGLRMS